MIETLKGLENAREIVCVPGIDLVFIGTGDLGLALDHLPDQKERLRRACDEIFAVCRSADVPCGIFTSDAVEAVSRREQGYAMTVIANDIGIVALGFGAAMTRFLQA